MGKWGEILKELKAEREKGVMLPFDPVRRKYLKKLSEHTGRATILYATKWTQDANLPAGLLSISFEDVQGFVEVASDLSGDKLDLILHSPGGSAEATEALVKYLRTEFDHIRVIIPYAAMSAATMLACSADEVVMGTHSFIGPIDPQVIVHTRLGVRAVPAQAILAQFQLAKDECKEDPRKLGVWLPIVEQYGPALLVECEHAIDLSKTLVHEWLAKYMYANNTDAADTAKTVAATLADHSLFKSHGRHIDRQKAKSIGLKIEDLEADKALHDLVLSVFHATTHTFDGTNAVKIIENNHGISFMKQVHAIAVPAPSLPPSQDGK